MADFNYSYEVCTCKGVTLGEIVYSIEKQGAKTIEDVANITDAGSACGCCKTKEDDFGDPKMKLYIEQIVNKFVK
ncbi:MAG: (2Fe-2S)-binding protein [Campylobacterota bacterium]|nr:(2Fe-2S)-binding protein [Campylobacterota bacterium]